jgi:hypothetical protein
MGSRARGLYSQRQNHCGIQNAKAGPEFCLRVESRASPAARSNLAYDWAKRAVSMLRRAEIAEPPVWLSRDTFH